MDAPPTSTRGGKRVFTAAVAVYESVLCTAVLLLLYCCVPVGGVLANVQLRFRAADRGEAGR